MREARITYNDLSIHHYVSEITALNDLKNKLDFIYGEDITLKLEAYYEKNKELKFDIIAFKSDWEYGKVGILEVLK